MTGALVLVALLAQGGGSGAAAAPAAPPGAPSPAPAPAAGRRAPALERAALRALAAADPPIDALRAAATALVLAEPARARGLLGRARWAGWLPELRLRVDRRFNRAESVDLSPNSPDAPTSPVGLDTDNDVRYECRATWDLSRLVFNPDEIAAGSQALRMADVRREIESLVIRLYFERRRLKGEALTTDGTDVASSVRLDLRIEEVEAELDALTGGAFSRLRSSRGGEPSFAAP